VPQQIRCQRSQPIDPPPPTSRASFARLGPRHAQGRVEGGELTEHDSAISPHVFLREVFLQSHPLETEGAGNAGRPMRPIAACAMVVIERTRVVRSHRNHPAFPAQWFTDYCVLSSVLRAFWPPSPVKVSFHELDTSVGVSEPHAFSVRKKALSSVALLASTASRPAFATIMIRPFWWDGTSRDIG